MVDCHTPSQRSRNMRRIRSADTQPERIVRKIAHGLGLRFRLYRRDLPGTPDLVFPKHRSVVFVHGCFWHQHKGCRFAKLPRSRPEYWLPKLARNTERDAEARRLLEAANWRVLEIWECETRSTIATEAILRRFFDFGG